MNLTTLLSHEAFERFLNGLIRSQRGTKPNAEEPVLELNNGNVNNLMLKKIKIALSLSTDEMMDIFEQAGVMVSKDELGATLRKEGYRNYKPCLDKYTRNFLKGFTIEYRDN